MTTAIKRREIVAAQPASAVRWTAELASIELRFGAGCLADVGQAARDLGGSRCLVVTDPGVAAAGYGERAIRSLADAGLAAELFTGVGENPTTDQVVEGTEAARRFGADLLVGLGGGSPMDCAKGINFLLTNGGQMADYWGFGKAALPMLPTIGVPTTAGTGSEAQSYCLISDPLTHRKMACGDRKARFRIVLFDPELLTTTPRAVVATALMDAVSHAVETAVTRTRNPISVLLSREAWHRLTQRVPELLEGDEVAREEVLLGAHLAGAAIESSMLGAALQ